MTVLKQKKLLIMMLILCLSLLVGLVASSEYSVKCDAVFCRVLDASQKEISKLKLEVDNGNCVPGFGSKADSICLSAVEQFVQDSPIDNADDRDAVSLHDRKISDLEKMLDAPLHVIYLKQLALLREKALKLFTQGITKPGNEFESLMRADEFFKREAEDATRQQSDWTPSREIKDLKTCLSEMAAQSRKITEAKLEASRQNAVAIQSMQTQNQQMQSLLQQMQGGSNPWKINAAYRVPDTNFNIQCQYQQGRANVQISCVPDESIHLLGADELPEMSTEIFNNLVDSAIKTNETAQKDYTEVKSKRNRLALQASEDLLKVRWNLQAQCNNVGLLIRNLIDRRNHHQYWEDKFREYGGYDHDYACFVHGETKRNIDIAINMLMKPGIQIQDVSLGYDPVFCGTGGSDGKLNLSFKVKRGFSTQSTLTDSSEWACAAEAYMKMNKIWSVFTEAKGSVSGSSKFTHLSNTMSCRHEEVEHEESWVIDLSKPCYVYTPVVTIRSSDNTFALFRGNLIQRSDPLIE